MNLVLIPSLGGRMRRTAATRRDLLAILFDGALFSLMVGMGETYFAAYALATQSGEIAAGLLASMPMLVGAALQLATPWAVRRLGSYRRWVVITASLQALSLFLLPLAALVGGLSVALIFLAATLYWAGGLATNPAWNTWIEELVPKFVRTHFFARRVRISQLCILAGFVLSGLWLELGKYTDKLLLAFGSLFLLAGSARLLSAACLASQSETASPVAIRNHVRLRDLWGRLGGHSGARLIWYLFAVQIAVQTSGPYFAPFMLGQLKMSYAHYVLLISFAFLGKVVALPLWGKVAHLAGPRTLLWIGGVAIVPVSGFWLGLWWIERPMVFLIGVQFVGGIAWAAYELAFFLMFFESIPQRERTSLLTLYNFGNAGALAVGSILGAVWLYGFGENRDSYLMLFGVSTLMRLAALLFLCRVPKPVTSGDEHRRKPPVLVPALEIAPRRPAPDPAFVDGVSQVTVLPLVGSAGPPVGERHSSAPPAPALPLGASTSSPVDAAAASQAV